ncbi:MAG: hypothetical protein ACQEP8_05190 [Chlamydiota bacterium]
MLEAVNFYSTCDAIIDKLSSVNAADEQSVRALDRQVSALGCQILANNPVEDCEECQRRLERVRSIAHSHPDLRLLAAQVNDRIRGTATLMVANNLDKFPGNPFDYAEKFLVGIVGYHYRRQIFEEATSLQGNLGLNRRCFSFYQNNIVKKARQYYTWPKKDLAGLCFGLSLLYALYQFKGQRLDFFRTIDVLRRADISKIKEEKETLTPLETISKRFLEDVVKLQSNKDDIHQTHPVEKMKQLCEDPRIQRLSSRFQYVSAFSYDDEKGSYRTLEEALYKIINVDSAPKLLLCCTNVHAFALFSREGELDFYDPNNPTIWSSTGEGDKQEVANIVKQMTMLLDTKNQELVLAINVISDSALENLEELKANLYPRIEKGSPQGYRRNILALAVDCNLSEVVKEILDNHPIDDQAVKDAFDIAVRINLNDVAKKFVDNPYYWSRSNRSFWDSIVNCQNETMLEYLADDVDRVDEQGLTPLLHQALRGKREGFYFLLRWGASINKGRIDNPRVSIHLARLARIAPAAFDNVYSLLSKIDIDLTVLEILHRQREGQRCYIKRQEHRKPKRV